MMVLAYGLRMERIGMGRPSEQDQQAGLEQVATLLSRRGCQCSVQASSGDVLGLRARDESGVAGTVEVVCAAGGYDLWREGRLAEVGVSVEAAAEAVVRDYRQAKANAIADRRIAQGKTPPGVTRARIVTESLRRLGQQGR